MGWSWWRGGGVSVTSRICREDGQTDAEQVQGASISLLLSHFSFHDLFLGNINLKTCMCSKLGPCQCQ